jgi:hypothetical protein
VGGAGAIREAISKSILTKDKSEEVGYDVSKKQ